MLNLIIKCAERFEKIARPIPIDKDDIRFLSIDLERKIEESIEDFESPLGNNKNVIRPYEYNLESVDGEEFPVWILIKSTEAENIPNYVINGGQGFAKDNVIIIININGSIPASKYVQTGGVVAKQLYTILIHELSHAAESKYEKGGLRTKEEHLDDMDFYYNQPSEVRAYMQEIVDDISKFSQHWARFQESFGSNEALEHLLNTSKVWREISHYFNNKNKNLIIKNVIQMLENKRTSS